MTHSLQQRKALRVLLVSLLFLSLCGTAFLVGYWSSHGSTVLGIKRSAVFVTLMVAVHAIGAALHLAQHREDAKVRPSASRISGPLHAAIRFAHVQHAIVIGLSFLVLDGGYTIRCWHIACAAFVAHWLMIAIVRHRSPASPPFVDLCLIRYAFVPLCLLFGMLVSGQYPG